MLLKLKAKKCSYISDGGIKNAYNSVADGVVDAANAIAKGVGHVADWIGDPRSNELAVVDFINQDHEPAFEMPEFYSPVNF